MNRSSLTGHVPVDCIVCGSNLATPTGGKAQIKAEIITAFE